MTLFTICRNLQNRITSGELPQDGQRVFAYVIEKSLIATSTRRNKGRPLADQIKGDFTITKDNYETSFAPWYVMIYGVFYESLSKFILESHQHGFTEHFERVGRIAPDRSVEENAKVLTMFMLSAGFYVWLGSVAVACLTFIVEHLIKSRKNKKDRPSQPAVI